MNFEFKFEGNKNEVKNYIYVILLLYSRYIVNIIYNYRFKLLITQIIKKMKNSNLKKKKKKNQNIK